MTGITKDGGFAEYVLVRDIAVVRVPSDLDPAETAPLLCAGVTNFNGLRHLGVPQGALVAVQGLGGLGHLGVQYANKMGYKVVALSRGSDKEKFAHELGAHYYIDTSAKDVAKELNALGGADVIVTTAPNPKAIEPLVYGLKAGGKLLILSVCGPVSFDTHILVDNGLSICGWPAGYAKDSEDAIDFAKTFGVKAMVEKFPFRDAQKAFDQMTSGKVRFRSVMVMDD
jgi:D-arabinose 1-dehydrogenase-like Zn-dependent alcohol dehydrogenase